jgi:hypothetical protein
LIIISHLRGIVQDSARTTALNGGHGTARPKMSGTKLSFAGLFRIFKFNVCRYWPDRHFIAGPAA